MKPGLVSPDFFVYFRFHFQKAHLTFLFTSVSLSESKVCNISIAEIAVSNLFQKSNVSINSFLILRTTNAVLELVTI